MAEHVMCEKSKVKLGGEVICVTGCPEHDVGRNRSCPFDGVPLEDECPCAEHTEE